MSSDNQGLTVLGINLHQPKSDMNNYRPISLTSVVAKLFEKVGFDQLYEHFDHTKILNSHQSGFRSLYSTLTALLEATNDCCINIDRTHLNSLQTGSPEALWKEGQSREGNGEREGKEGLHATH